MALVQATVSATIQAALGPAEDTAKQKEFCDSLAQALITILTAQMTIAVAVDPHPDGGAATGTGVAS